MNYSEALEIWKRNGLKPPEKPLDECIFPNANRLLEIEQINADLLEACFTAKCFFEDMQKDCLNRKGNRPQDFDSIIKVLQQTIAKAEVKV